MKKTIKINLNFPKKEFIYLKMLCEKENISINEFATDLILKAIEEYEDRILAKKARRCLKEMDSKDNIPFERVQKLFTS